MRTWLIWSAAILVFAIFYAMVAQKETLRRDGAEVFLKLAPLDPRSLVQGDYMALNYDLTNKLMLRMDAVSYTMPMVPSSGSIVVRLDAQNVGEFIRFDDGSPLAEGEHLLRFQHQDNSYRFGVERFYIPEGTGAAFDKAVYGDIRLAKSGDALLVGLRDRDFKPLAASAP